MERNVDLRTYRKRNWMYPELRFVSFSQGRLELLNTSYFDQISYTLLIVIEKDRLHVSCSCALKAVMLCRHAYKALSSILWVFDSTTYFEQYRPKGLVEIATAYKKYFVFNQSDRGLDTAPRAELGSVYHLKEKKPLRDLDRMLKSSAPVAYKLAKDKGIALTYMILYSHENKLLPFLLPCIAKLNRAGTAVKVFDNFISSAQKKHAPFLTDEQRTLNRLCYDMWKLVEKLPSSLIDQLAASDTEEAEKVFNLWQQAIPILQRQPFLFTYYLYNEKELKGKPARQRIDEAHIDNTVPSLHFQLSDKDAFYQLHMKVSLNGRELTKFDADINFFIRSEVTLYPLPSLQNAAVAEWMRESGGRITIFKEHYREFEQDILKPLGEYYKVKVMHS